MPEMPTPVRAFTCFPSTKRLNHAEIPAIRNDLETVRKLAAELGIIHKRLADYAELYERSESFPLCLPAVSEAARDLEDDVDEWLSAANVIPRDRRQEHVRSCHERETPWEVWAAYADYLYVPSTLVRLGKRLMEKSFRDSWPEDLCRDAGWDDAGMSMIALALNSPQIAESKWKRLLQLDNPTEPATFITTTKSLER